MTLGGDGASGLRGSGAWWTVLVALSSAGPVAARLWTQGPEQVRAALVLAAIALVCAIARSRLTTTWTFGVSALAFAVAAVLTQGTVGRAPVLVCGLFFVAASWMVPLSACSGSKPDQERQERLGLLPGLWLIGAAWWGWGNNAATAICLGALAGVAVLRRVRPGVLEIVTPVGRAIETFPRRVMTLVRRSQPSRSRARRRGAQLLRTAGRRRGASMSPRGRGGGRALVLSAAVALLVGLATAPIFWRLAVDHNVLIRGVNDLNSGFPRVQYMRIWPPRTSAAHPVWMLTIYVLMKVTSFAVATTLVSCLAIAGSVLVLIALARSRWDDRPALPWPWALAFGAGWVFIESPAVFLPRGESWWMRGVPWNRFASGTTFLLLHLWAVPTLVMSLPLAFSTPPLVLRLIDATEAGDQRVRRWGPLLAVHTVVLTLLLPATTLAYVPASVAYVIVTRRWSRRQIAVLGRWYVLPGTAVVLGQIAFLRSNVSPYEQATWLWRPFWALHRYGMDRPACYAIVAFFLACWWLGGRRFVTDPGVALSLLALVVSWPPFLLIRQTTVAAIPDADLAIPMVMSVLLLFVASARFAAIELIAGSSDATQLRRVAGAALILLVAVMFAAGIWDFGAAAGWLREA